MPVDEGMAREDRRGRVDGGGGDGRHVCGEVGGRCLGDHGACRGRDPRDVLCAWPMPARAAPSQHDERDQGVAEAAVRV